MAAAAAVAALQSPRRRHAKQKGNVFEFQISIFKWQTTGFSQNPVNSSYFICYEREPYDRAMFHLLFATLEFYENVLQTQNKMQFSEKEFGKGSERERKSVNVNLNENYRPR